MGGCYIEIARNGVSVFKLGLTLALLSRVKQAQLAKSINGSSRLNQALLVEILSEQVCMANSQPWLATMSCAYETTYSAQLSVKHLLHSHPTHQNDRPETVQWWHQTSGRKDIYLFSPL